MSEIQSLARGLQILDMIAERSSVSVTEIAALLDVDKSSASRLVKTLVNYGYLQPDSETRRLILGKRMHQMGWQLLNQMPVREHAKKYLYWLVAETGECAHTAVYSEGKALMIDDVESDVSRLRVVGGVGRTIPLHCTAVGKSLLAFSEVPRPAILTAWTARTITDWTRLNELLDAINRQGYAIDDEEYDQGVRCLAAPVYDHTGLAIAAIGISGPTVRMPDERLSRLAAQVIDAACRLSMELGHKEARVKILFDS